MATMRLEHVALNVVDPRAMAAWYVRYLDMRIARSGPAPAYGQFLLDADGAVMLEIYCSASTTVPAYAEMDPLQLHVAFATEDPDGARQRLIDGGATLLDDQQLDDGSRFIVLRDPWGLALQVCKRAKPLLDR